MFLVCLFVCLLLLLLLFLFCVFAFIEIIEVTEDIIICEAGHRQAGETILRATFTILL